jgi:hypothetical protein
MGDIADGRTINHPHRTGVHSNAVPRKREIPPHPILAPAAWFACLGLGLAFWYFVIASIFG